LRRKPVLSIELWLHRRVIEICDGQLALREWVTEADVPKALSQTQREAAWMRTAIDRKAAGLPCPSGPAPSWGTRDWHLSRNSAGACHSPT